MSLGRYGNKRERKIYTPGKIKLQVAGAKKDLRFYGAEGYDPKATVARHTKNQAAKRSRRKNRS